MTIGKRIIKCLVSALLGGAILIISGIVSWSWQMWVLLFGILPCLAISEWAWGLYQGEKIGYDKGFKDGFDQAVRAEMRRRETKSFIMGQRENLTRAMDDMKIGEGVRSKAWSAYNKGEEGDKE